MLKAVASDKQSCTLKNPTCFFSLPGLWFILTCTETLDNVWDFSLYCSVCCLAISLWQTWRATCMCGVKYALVAGKHSLWCPQMSGGEMKRDGAFLCCPGSMKATRCLWSERSHPRYMEGSLSNTFWPTRDGRRCRKLWVGHIIIFITPVI